MNIPLQRLIDGIIATLRSDVIPHVQDGYARGQAVGVIDLLNNIAPRVEWTQGLLSQRIEQKRALLAEVAGLVPGLPVTPQPGHPASSADDLVRVKADLDSAISDAIALIWPRRTEPGFDRAAGLVKAHLHDEMTAEMKLTRKPLFAEIASGSDGSKG